MAQSIRTFDGLSLEEERVEVLGGWESGDSIVAEIRVTTAVRLVRERGKWRMAEIRLGDRRWEKTDHILMLLDEQRIEATRTQLQQVNRVVHQHLESEGAVPQVVTLTARVNALYATFLETVVRFDAWSDSFLYEPLSLREYRLRSPGADGVAGMADDLSVETRS